MLKQTVKHSLKTMKNHQEVFDIYDELKSELPEEQKKHTKTSYYVEKIAEKTKYSESRVMQLLTNRYKKG